MSSRSALAASLLMLAVLAPPALASPPPGDPPPPSGPQHHVHRLKPWKAKYRYRIVRDVIARTELNVRADSAASVPKGGWFQIDCQLYNETQNGTVLWDHIGGTGWVPDSTFKTYTDGRLQGSPTCAKPGPNHVWFKQRWALAKQYRLAHRARAYDKPGGAPVGKLFAKASWTTTNCHSRHNGHQWAFIDFKTGTGWIRADALRFWQKGLPAGMPPCVKSPPPLRTWVAMGDSYASGQGANDYSGGSCRRSANAYWALLRNRLRHGIQTQASDFVACSGATTSAIHDHQLSALDPSTRLVTLSAGGDNLGFRFVMEGCVLPGGSSCKDEVHKHVTKASLKAMRAALRGLYADIRGRAPNATVLVLGYPQLVPKDHIDGCGAMDDTDAPVLHHAGDRINRSIRDAVGKRRGFRFISLVATFKDHPACNSGVDDWINGVEHDKQESFHPNELGHGAIAAKLRSAAPGFFR